MELYEWTKHYIKFKDCMKKRIKELVFEDKKIIAKEKDEDKTYYISEKIGDIINKIDKENTTILVCLNTEENVNKINEKWDLLRKNPKLTIIFAQIKNNESWSIHPNTHHKIAENVKDGLKTLYKSITSAD